MFSRVIPNWDAIRSFTQPLTQGEEALVRYLDEHLTRDDSFLDGSDLTSYRGWLIFVQPFLNGSRPDIIIFNPQVGVQIFEVKDWSLRHYHYKGKEPSKSVLHVSDSVGSHPIKSPVKQVEFYKELLAGQLVPQLGEAIDGDKSAYGLIKTGVYFHNASSEEILGLFKQGPDSKSKTPLLARTDLTLEGVPKAVPDASRKTSTYWKQEWNKDVLFWLIPPFHFTEQSTRLTLNKHQGRFAQPQVGHHRVRGVAGSGKTQVLAYRAGALAAQGFDVLSLTFNITLWHYIRDMIQRSPFEFPWERITFNHFHGFCKLVLNEAGERWPKDPEDGSDVFKTVIVEKVLSALRRLPHRRYDAILIDEGQDYHVEWYQMLRACLTKRNEVVVVCDKKQNIYGRDMDWLDKRRSGVEQFGDWIELKTIVRLPERVARLAREYSERYNLNQDVRVDRVERPDLFNQYTEHTVWWNIENRQWRPKLVEAYELMVGQATSKQVSDTVILLPDAKRGLECARHFEEKRNIKVNHVFEDEHEKRFHRRKRAFWMGDGRLKMSTIHSFKGWEVLNVILFLPDTIMGDEELYDRLVYTAITRTRQNLIVINACSRYREFGASLPTSWHEQ